MTDRSRAVMSGPVKAFQLLRQTSIHAEVDEQTVCTQIEHVFINDGRRQVELIYRFPVPWGAVLLEATVTTAKGVRVAKVQASEQGNAAYEKASNGGWKPYLLESAWNAIQTLSIGRLEPNERCEVRTRWISRLELDATGARLRFPTVLHPDEAADPSLPRQAHELLAEYPCHFTLALRGALTQSRIESPSHALHVIPKLGSREPSELQVTLAHPAWLDRDVVIVLTPPVVPSITRLMPDTRASAKAQAVLGRFMPPASPLRDRQPLSLRLVVDGDFFMGPQALEAVQQALFAVLDELRPGDRFGLAVMGGMLRQRGRQFWTVGPATLEAARRWVSRLRPDREDHCLGKHLMEVVEKSTDEPHDLLLITGGRYLDPNALPDYGAITQHRVSVWAVGSCLAEAGLRQLVAQTHGIWDSLVVGENSEPLVARLMQRLRSPGWHTVELKWPKGTQVTWQAPLPARSVAGSAITVAARLAEVGDGPIEVWARATRDEAAQCIGTIPLELGGNEDAVRWIAMQQIQGLDAPQAQALALQYELVSRHTSAFLVFERNPSSAWPEPPRQYVVPQMIPAGWAGVSRVERKPQPAWNPDVPVVFRNARPTDAAPRFSLRAGAGPAPAPQPPQPYTLLCPLPQYLKRRIMTNPRSDWPVSYADLLEFGVPRPVVEWLELVAVPQLPGDQRTEAMGVLLFVLAISRRICELRGQPFDESDEFEVFAACDETARKIMTGLVADAELDAWPARVDLMT